MSVRTIKDARAIQEQAAPELIAAVERGKVAVSAANGGGLVVRRELLDNLHDPAWGTPSLGRRFDVLRPHQKIAITEVVETFERGRDIVAMDAPTGSGKTLIAECVRRLLDVSAVYVCTTIALQDQFLRDFDSACLIKGRRNYLPHAAVRDREGERLTCADCDGGRCRLCTPRERCPYTLAKAAALDAPLAVLNTHYLLSEMNYVGAFSGRALGIIDEADGLENILLSFVEFNLPWRTLRLLRAPEPPAAADAWPAWIACLLAVILRRCGELENVIVTALDNLVEARRELDRLRSLGQRAHRFAADLASGGEWVRVPDRASVVFKPITVARFAEACLWRHAERWLLMSATILDPGALLRDLGQDGTRLSRAHVIVPSTFPPERRPLLKNPIARVTRANEATAFPVIARRVRDIAAQHATERILVHTVSTAFKNAIRQEIGDDPVMRDRAVWHEPGELSACLARYRALPNAVLIGPAMERGLDLPDDQCRVIVVCRLPCLSLGDPQVQAREALDSEWYELHALRSLVQATGRGMRSIDDWCTVYLLDEKIIDAINVHRHRWLSDEWCAAVRWARTPVL